jgi:hypothetical protein
MPNGIRFTSPEIELRVKMGTPTSRTPDPDGLYTNFCYADGTLISVIGPGAPAVEKSGTVMGITIGGCAN